MPNYTCTCGAKFRFAEASAGKRSRCTHCGAIFTLPVVDENEGTIPLAQEHDQPSGPAAAILQTGQPHANEPVFDPLRQPPRNQIALDDDSNQRTYLGDVMRAFIFFGKPADFVTLFFVFLMILFTKFIPLAGCVGLIILVIMTCWYCAYRFEVLVEAAAGERVLPDLSNSLDIRSEFLGPLLNWMASWLVAMAPAFIYGIIQIWRGKLSLAPSAASGVGLVALTRMAMESHDFPLFLLILFGAFVWPLIVLCVAIGGFSCVFAVEPFVRTLFQTLPPYALTIAIVFSSDFARTLLPSVAPSIAWLDSPIRVYFDIVSMRAIGLYYHHFKHDFAYDWE